jgi:hypothetical protein
VCVCRDVWLTGLRAGGHSFAGHEEYTRMHIRVFTAEGSAVGKELDKSQWTLLGEVRAQVHMNCIKPKRMRCLGGSWRTPHIGPLFVLAYIQCLDAFVLLFTLLKAALELQAQNFNLPRVEVGDSQAQYHTIPFKTIHVPANSVMPLPQLLRLMYTMLVATGCVCVHLLLCFWAGACLLHPHRSAERSCY